MSQASDLFNPEKLFSNENPFVQGLYKGHRLMFEAADKTARVQLGFIEELLDINRRRFETLYAGKSFKDTVAAEQDLATELGKRTAQYVGDLQEVVGEMQAGVSEAANDLGTAAQKAGGSKKTKAAA